MAQDTTMHGHSWSLRSRVAAHLAPMKDYLPQHLHLHLHHHQQNLSTETGCVDDDANKHSLSHFANRIFARRSYSDSEVVTSTERVVLLPGWASRRYRAGPNLTSRAGAPYDIEIFVSGYVVKHKAQNTLSRSQRNILGLAKRIASLPKLPDLHHDDAEDVLPHEAHCSAESVEDLLSRTTLPDDNNEEHEAHALHESPKAVSPDLRSMPISAAASSDGFPLSISTSVPIPRELPPVSATSSHSGHDHIHLRRWHSNLEMRLHPFWAGVLSNRSVRVSVSPHYDSTDADAEPMSSSTTTPLEEPLGSHVVVTDADGGFKVQFVIRWESLCGHPKGASMTSVDPNLEHDFSITAELMPPSPPGSPNMSTEPQSATLPSPTSSLPTPITCGRVPLTYSPVRVISDIDDTVKLSEIQCGLRTVFHNVFVKDLVDNLIPGMGEWYTEMWHRGVRFHYVSNGPFALLPVITEFFQVAKLPAGSVRLRSHGTRAILSDLLSQPSDRKRDAVLELLTSFPHSRFILIGDSGEQDLELYAAVARDHPEQILCIFIRDVNTYEDGGDGIEDPTGIHARDCAKKRSTWGISMSRGGRLSPKSLSPPSSPSMSRTSSESTNDYSSRTPTSATSGMQKPYTDTHTLYSEPESYDNHSQTTITHMHTISTLTQRLTLSLSEPERKRMHLQTRLWKACAEVPANVVIRIFRDPLECVESFQVIDPHLPKNSN